MTSKITLAVLPFKVAPQKGTTITRHFEEDLVYHLSKFQGLTVLSYFSTRQWSVEQEEVLRKYGVTHIITGSFRAVKDHTLIHVQLIELPGHQVIYDQRIDYKETDVFELQDRAILQITNLLQNQLNQSILSKSYERPEVDLASYELLLMGNAALKNGTPEDDQKARNLFEEALKKQPDYSRAYAGISSSYFNQWSCQLWDRWEISQNGAKKYALKAIELDENDYQALCILGRVLLFERDFEQAEFYLRKSLEMNNNDASTLLEVAFSFMFLGQSKAALNLYERACQLNPMKEDKYLSVGATLMFENGDFEEALALGKQLEISSTYIDFPIYMGAAAYYGGDEQTAMQYWDHFLNKFKKHIYFADKRNIQDPLSWHIQVNPYRAATRLSKFHTFIKSKFDLKVDLTPTSPVLNHQGTVSITQDQVTLSYSSKTITLNKSKGLLDLAKLLERPHEEIHCLELMQAHQTVQQGVAILDEQAKKAYRNRLLDLQTEIEEAENMNNADRFRKLSIEYDELVDHLSASLGYRSASRKTGSDAEKARAAVTLRIRDCIKKIAQSNEVMGAHLRNSIKTGMLCSYQPETAIEWEISHE